MATTLINFDAGFSTGALNGQNGWTTSGTEIQVSNAQYVSSPNSFRRATGANWIVGTKTLTPTPTGSISFMWRTVGTHSDPFRGLQFAVRNQAEQVCFNIGTLNTSTTGVQGSTTSGSLGSFSTNTWYLFEAEWDYATQKIRGRFNGGSWSSWLDPLVAWDTMDSISVLSLNQEFFIDDITWVIPDPPFDYQISGTVTLNGSPVEGATIRCVRQSDNVAITEVTSDEAGEYTFTDLEETELYHLCVEFEDETQKYYAKSYWDIAPVEVEL